MLFRCHFHYSVFHLHRYNFFVIFLVVVGGVMMLHLVDINVVVMKSARLDQCMFLPLSVSVPLS